MMTRRQIIGGIAGTLATRQVSAMLIGSRDGGKTIAATTMNALWLDGTENSWTHFDSVPRVSSPAYSPCSISLWARLTPKTTIGNMRSHMMFSIIHNTIGPAMDYRENKFIPGIQGKAWYNAGVSMDPFGSWHHYAMTMSSSQVISVYVDGRYRGTQNIGYSSSSYTGTLSLGGQYYQRTLYDMPLGGIANVEIFDCELSSTDIAALGAGIDVVNNTAVHRYLFEDGAEDTGLVGGWHATMGMTARIAPIE